MKFLKMHRTSIIKVRCHNNPDSSVVREVDTIFDCVEHYWEAEFDNRKPTITLIFDKVSYFIDFVLKLIQIANKFLK